MKKFAFVIPPSLDDKNVITDYMAGLGLKVAGEESSLPPLSLLYTATILKKSGSQVVFFDCPAQKINFDALLKKLSRFQPQKVFLEIRYPSIIDDIRVAQAIKKLPTRVYLVGPLAHFLKKELETRFPGLDGIVPEEMEVTIPAICQRRQAGQSRVANLDVLPFPDRKLLKAGHYFFRTLPFGPLATVLTTRGCPYGCLYCPYHIIQGKSQRQRSVANVIGELQLLAKEGVRSILFRDPTFTLDRQRTINLMQAILRNQLNFQWWCETRTDCLDKDLLSLMKKAGLQGFNFGVESGSGKIRQAMGRKTWEKAQTQKIIQIARNLKIKTKAFFILGLPGETKKTLQETINYAIFLDPDYASFMIATPFPGTKLFDEFRQQGHTAAEFFQKPDIKFIAKGLSFQDLEQAERQAVKKFYLRRRPMIASFKLLGSFSGFKESLSYLKWVLKHE